MSETKLWTKGWTVDRSEAHAIRVRDNRGWIIASYPRSGHGAGPEGEQIMTLIAGAHAIAEALEMALPILAEHAEGCSPDPNLSPETRALLKARTALSALSVTPGAPEHG